MVDLDAQRDTAQGSFLYESSAMRFSSPLFAELARHCAADPDILELSAVARRGQPIAMFVMLATQYLLFRSPQEKLARYFPSMTSTPKPAAEAFPLFREFCLERRSELMHLLATRTVNSNLVERASTIVPAIQHVKTLAGEPLTLVEICCSAGLNLLFDEYHYDYGTAGQVGNEDAAVRLSSKVLGEHRPPIQAVPLVAEKIGVDLVTVDCSDPDARVWMEAMLFPEWRDEREHLKKALLLRAARKSRMLTGSAPEVLPALLLELQGPVVVLHSYCMGQWPDEAQSRLDEVLRAASHHRDIHRVGIEVPGTEPAEGVRARLAALSRAGISIRQKCLPSRIEHTHYKKGAGQAELLGYADGFGAWIDWRRAPQLGPTAGCTC